jgi:hypothetical protein
VHCPVVHPAVAWLRGVWALNVPGRVPPLDARVLLAGDHTVWDPGGGEAGAELWAHPPAPSVLPCGLVPALLQGGPWTGVHCFCCVALTATWIRHAVRLDWLRVSADFAGTAPTLPSWCIIHKRFDMSQAEFIKRWCLNSVLAEVSSDADESATVRVHVPPLAVVTVPVAQ